MEPHIWDMLEHIRPTAKLRMTAVIQAADLLKWKKIRIARVQTWKKKKGR
jgi:hypothetical protein